MLKFHAFLIITGIAMCTLVLSFAVFLQLHQLGDTRVIFLDVGQGDAILIMEGTQQILIDGGPDGKRLQEELSRFMPFWDRTIEVVIATHPDTDHIDGLIPIFDAYKIKHFWQTQSEKETHTANALRSRVARENTQMHMPIIGEEIRFASGALFRIVFPHSDTFVTDINDHSIAATFHVGDEVFFFGGDLSRAVEDQLLVPDTVTVLKAGHHGSNTSTSEIFLQKTRPRDVIISAGEGNRYGHPDKKVLTRVYRSGARIFRTDRDGHIIYQCFNGNCEISMSQRHGYK